MFDQSTLMGYYSHFEKLYYIRFNIVNLVFVSRLSPEILRRQNRLPWLRFALVCLLHTPTKFHEPTGNKYTITLKQTEYNIVSSKGMVISPAKVTPSNISRRNFFNIPSTMFDMQFNEGVTAQLKKSILNLGLKTVNLVFVSRLPLKFWDGKTAYHECLILAMFRMTNCNQRKDSSTNV